MGVLILAFLANRFRIKKLNWTEQLIMMYGGLRGGVAFALVLLIKQDFAPHAKIFVTTTLAMVYWTVFVQVNSLSCSYHCYCCWRYIKVEKVCTSHWISCFNPIPLKFLRFIAKDVPMPMPMQGETAGGAKITPTRLEWGQLICSYHLLFINLMIISLSGYYNQTCGPVL